MEQTHTTIANDKTAHIITLHDDNTVEVVVYDDQANCGDWSHLMRSTSVTDDNAQSIYQRARVAADPCAYVLACRANHKRGDHKSA